MTVESKLKFWQSRADLGDTAGTNDFPLKNLELELILQRVRPGSTVLDLGCGNGQTLLRLAQQNRCTGLGIDFSEKMVREAEAACKAAGCVEKLQFKIGSILNPPSAIGEYDYALTERSLINLDSLAQQQQAFLEIMRHVVRGGYYLMIESSIQGLERTNKLRQQLGLEKIDPPWHNLFIDEAAVLGWPTDEYLLEEVYPFTSTYHFLSRVVYAKLASDRGEELKYDSDINKLACKLPPIGDFGPVRLWLWHRR